MKTWTIRLTATKEQTLTFDVRAHTEPEARLRAVEIAISHDWVGCDCESWNDEAMFSTSVLKVEDFEDA